MQKQTILSAAEKLFYAKRYTDVKLDAIANKLSIQKPSLYHYFSNKKDLFFQTLKNSQKIYFTVFKKILISQNAKQLIERYLTFPNKQKNLFGISFQRDYCLDNEVRKFIFFNKQQVVHELTNFFSKSDLDEVEIFLLMNLLEKLVQNNCLDKYCLKYDAATLAEGIVRRFGL